MRMAATPHGTLSREIIPVPPPTEPCSTGPSPAPAMAAMALSGVLVGMRTSLRKASLVSPTSGGMTSTARPWAGSGGPGCSDRLAASIRWKAVIGYPAIHGFQIPLPGGGTAGRKFIIPRRRPGTLVALSCPTKRVSGFWRGFQNGDGDHGQDQDGETDQGE